MKNKFRFVIFLLIISLCYIPSLTLGAEGTTFVDVGPEDWFAHYVEACAEAGLMGGSGDGVFAPERTLTQAELFSACARLHHYLTQGVAQLEPVSEELFAQVPPQVRGVFPTWFLDANYYLSAALLGEEPDMESLASLTEEETAQIFQLPATRLELATFLFGTLEGLMEKGQFLLEPVNDIPYLPDTNSEAVLAFCRAGVFTGVDKEGTFRGEGSLTRGELAAVLARILDPELRVRFSLIPKTQWDNFSLTPLPIPEGYCQTAFSMRWGDEFDYFIGTSYLPVVNDYADYKNLSDRRMGLLNAEGEWAIEPEWTSLEYLCPDGFAYARLWGENYKPLAEPRFVGVDGRQVAFPEMVRDMSYRHDQVLLFSEWEGQEIVTRVYDLNGNLTATLPGTVRLSSTEGRIPYQDPESGLWGFYDLTGTLVIPALYEDVKYFSEGLAAVETEGKWGFLDLEGTMVIPPQFESSSRPYYPPACQFQFYEGMAVVPQLQDDGSALYGVIDREGRQVLPFQYTELGRISDGMIAYWREGSTGYVNLSSGQEVPLERNGKTDNNTRPFSGGAAPFRPWWTNDDICGYIDKTGEFITPVLFDWAGPIGEDGAGFVNIGGTVYRIQFTGKE